MLAFVTLLVEIEDDIEGYLEAENTPDEIILVRNHNFAKSNQDEPNVLKRITPIDLKGVEAVTKLSEKDNYEQTREILESHIDTLKRWLT